MKQLFTFLIILYFSFFIVESTIAQVVPVQNGNIYSLSVGDVEIQVNASVGARITSLKLKGTEYIKQGGNSNQYGSTLWTSPQSVWNWPPLSTTDSRAYTATIDGNKMIFESGTETGISGKRFKIFKTFWANENDSSISIRYTLENTGTSSISASLWEITRVGPEGLTFWKTGDKEPWTSDSWNLSLVNGVEEESEFYWMEFSTSYGNSNKFFSGIGEAGWFAHAFDDNVVLIKSFEDVTSDDYAPGEGEFEYYTAGSYIELENQGKYTTVEAGETLNYDVTWHLQELPKSITAEIGSTELIDFVQGIVNAEIPTAISKMELLETNLFPNPVNDVLTINIQNRKEDKAILNLSDMSGRLVLSKEFRNNTPINVSYLRDGVYFYKITSNKKTSIGKLVKQ